MPVAKSRRSISDDDPLTRAMAPPPDETPEQREQRLQREKEARERSEAIDNEINQQRLAEKREQAPVKVLLLGQSESGKTTTLKNFQLISSPKAFRAEKPLWRAIIQLNVTRSIRIILEAMSQALAQSSNSSPTLTSSRPASPNLSGSSTLPSTTLPTLNAEHMKLKIRLSPLLQVEEALWRKLSPSSPPDAMPTHLSSVTNLPHHGRQREGAVYSVSGWKGAFSKLLTGRNSMDSQNIDFDNPDDPGTILHYCAQDMIRLWNDPVIQQLLAALSLRLEDMPGFFLDSLERVTALKYIPTDDDILRARLKTIGVSEHRFHLKAGNMLSRDWRVFDVGGARSLRGEHGLTVTDAFHTDLILNGSAAWVPFFDDMNAIIFLAPLSCFDQSLAEDNTEDSILLWRHIVQHKLLTKTELILFLNKCDILKAKLESGIQFSKWVISYGDRPNTFESTSNYMRKKFGTIHKQLSATPRIFYCHFTSVTDVKSTFQILENVKDLIVRKNLSGSHLV
uniref:Guanine nucleotide-binding protein alpha-4 subunit n=1 Tax=Moniliophthora roreri TaxID=221103 RepID=A0A0W0FWU8_MONRR